METETTQRSDGAQDKPVEKVSAPGKTWIQGLRRLETPPAKRSFRLLRGLRQR